MGQSAAGSVSGFRCFTLSDWCSPPACFFGQLIRMYVVGLCARLGLVLIQGGRFKRALVYAVNITRSETSHATQAPCHREYTDYLWAQQQYYCGISLVYVYLSSVAPFFAGARRHTNNLVLTRHTREIEAKLRLRKA